MTEERYNGWENWETWNVQLWLANDEGTYTMLLGMVAERLTDDPDEDAWDIGQMVKGEIEFWMDEGIRLVGDEVSWHRVNWNEIGEAWLEMGREQVAQDA